MAVLRTGTKQGGVVVPSGAIMSFATVSIPYDWLPCDGAAVNRTTYSTLFNTIVPSKGTFTVTIASPAVFTLNNHGLNTDDAVYLTTTGALPTGLTANTIYYVIFVSTNTFNLATTRGGTAISTSGSQSGTHTLYFCPYGLGDGANTFNVPDMRGRVAAGLDNLGGTAAGILNVSKALGLSGGEQNHTLSTTEMASHGHGVTDGGHYHFVATGGSAFANYAQNAGDGSVLGGLAWWAGANVSVPNAGSSSSHNNMQPYILMAYAIKT